MPEVSATDAARNFADLLDAVEHRGDSFTVVRRGKAIAQLVPVDRGRGSDVKAVLRRNMADSNWAADIAALRRSVEIDRRE